MSNENIEVPEGTANATQPNAVGDDPNAENGGGK